MLGQGDSLSARSFVFAGLPRGMYSVAVETEEGRAAWEGLEVEPGRERSVSLEIEPAE